MKKVSIQGALFLCVALTASAGNEWWPQFRGPNAAGVSESARPPVEFGPGQNQLWKVTMPSGFSSPCIWGDRIFLTAFDQGKLWTLCHRRTDGKLLWKRDAGAKQIEEYHRTEGSPAASTPVTDGQHVVSYFGSCGLICYNVDGEELWRFELPTAMTTGGFGSGASPILVGRRVILNRDQATENALLAVDLHTGREVWRTPRPDVRQSYATPMLWQHDGMVDLVLAGSFKLKAYDAKTGLERWSLDGLPAMTCTTPVAGAGMLFFAGWSPNQADNIPSFEQLAQKADANHDRRITFEEAKAAGADTWFRSMDVNRDGVQTPEEIEQMRAIIAKGRNVLLALKPIGEGRPPEQQIAWERQRGLPYVPSPLYYRGRVYLIKDGGMFSSFDAPTGRPYYEQERLGTRGKYYSSPVAADGRIYVASLEGVVTVIKAGGEMPEILHRASFEEKIKATPALVGEHLYLRTANALYAFGRS